MTWSLFSAFSLAFFLTMIAMPSWISHLRRCGWEQAFREKEEVHNLAELHASKAHTPTIGGVVFVSIGAFVALLIAPINLPLIAAMFIFITYAILGMCDDLAKMRKKNSRGIRGRTKLCLQALLCAVVLISVAHFSEEYFLTLHRIHVPFIGRSPTIYLPTAILFPFFFLVLAGAANGVNLSDGLDGLASICGLLNIFPLIVVCLCVGSPFFAHAHSICHVPGCESLAIFLSSVGGALLAFLWYNAHPAQIFMGDTGSLAIGGLLGVVAFFTLQPFLLAIMGGVFVCESLSVILQVYHCKWTNGRRIFRMAPLHHHFELCGWKETQIVIRFAIVSVACSAIAISLFFS